MERRTLLRTAGGWTLAGLGAVGIAACSRSAPVLNVEGASFQGRAPLRQRAEQIKRAGAGCGWLMQDVQTGFIRDTLDVRGHQAVVDVAYTPATFSSRYAASNNLNSTGSKIHSNYSSGECNLEQRIAAESSA